MPLSTLIPVENIIKASYRLNGVIRETPLQHNLNLSEKYGASIYLKREDLQYVRSYKIRGAYNLMSQLSAEQHAKGAVCASAGNHAQGFAYSCKLLGIKGRIYMPTTTPSQKVKRVNYLGGDNVDIVLFGDTFDEANTEAIRFSQTNDVALIPPFDHPLIVEGQGTVAAEILKQIKGHVDYIFVPIGGGGLISGIGSYLKILSPDTKIIGVEPLGAPAMKEALSAGKVLTINNIDTFVDGAAVRRVGQINFDITQKVVSDICLVPEGEICSLILQLYNDDAIVAEPAGALSIAALSQYAPQIKGKNVVCIVSGGNNDIERMPDIKERSLIYEGLKHYFIIQFPQRPGALREFLDQVLSPNDNISYFEYAKRNSRTSGAALVGIELLYKKDYSALISRLKELHIAYTEINKNRTLFNFLL